MQRYLFIPLLANHYLFLIARHGEVQLPGAHKRNFLKVSLLFGFARYRKGNQTKNDIYFQAKKLIHNPIPV